MSDPIERLETFERETPGVRPLPPSEVRRLGDRLRRRTAVFSAVGAAAVVALIAAPLAVVAGDQDRSAPPVTNPTSVAPSPTPDGTPDPPADPSVTPSQDIPADFPIDLDQTAMTLDGGRMYGPSYDAPGVLDANICGAAPSAVRYQDRLASTATGPEYEDSRDLRTYPSADRAVAVLAALRSAVRACPDDSWEGMAKTWTVYDVDTGYDSLTFSLTYPEGLGGAIYQYVRVGRAILATYVGGEFSADSVVQSIPAQTELGARIIPSMCLFTEDGC